MLKKFYISLGILSTLVGLIGIFLPLLPTTPFLILSAYFFSKGSPRLHRWLREHPFLGPSLRNWEDHRSISLNAKISASFLILVSISYPVLLLKFKMALKITAIISAGFILIFIWTRPTQT